MGEMMICELWVIHTRTGYIVALFRKAQRCCCRIRPTRSYDTTMKLWKISALQLITLFILYTVTAELTQFSAKACVAHLGGAKASKQTEIEILVHTYSKKHPSVGPSQTKCGAVEMQSIRIFIVQSLFIRSSNNNSNGSRKFGSCSIIGPKEVMVILVEL